MQLSDSKRISLWLLPPDPLRKTLSFIQSDIISKHGNNPATKDLRITTPHLLPTFEPHVTLIGGVPISDCCSPEEVAASIEPRTDVDGIDDDAAQLVLGRLQRAFRSHGGVDCNFVKERGVFAARDAETGIVRWNQSCTAIVERSASFMRAMEIADEALFLTSRATSSHDNRQQLQPIERHFKPPLCELVRLRQRSRINTGFAGMPAVVHVDGNGSSMDIPVIIGGREALENDWTSLYDITF